MAHDECWTLMIRVDYKMFGTLTKSNQADFVAFQTDDVCWLFVFICHLFRRLMVYYLVNCCNKLTVSQAIKDRYCTAVVVVFGSKLSILFVIPKH